MVFSPLANMKRRIPDLGRSTPRLDRISGFGCHHNAGVNAFGQATDRSREVSANYWITNEGDILPHIPEERRAFTSGAVGYPAGALADHRNITLEISNSPEGARSGSWAISSAAEAAVIALFADVYRRYNLGPIVRSATRGIGVHNDWVPTVCPGPYFLANLPSYIARANQLLSGSGTTVHPDEDDYFTEEDGDMKPTVIMRADGKPEWTRGHPNIGRDLKPGASRISGKVTVFFGYEVTASPTIGKAWSRMHSNGSGAPLQTLKRSDYISVQKEFLRLARYFKNVDDRVQNVRGK